MTTEPQVIEVPVAHPAVGLSEQSIGYAYALMVLYAHRDILAASLKDPAKRIVEHRRGAVVQRGHFHPSVLVRRGEHGIYPWAPGAECMNRDFRFTKLDPATGKITKGEPVKGCPDCRKQPAEVSQAPAAVTTKPDREAELLARIAALEAQIESRTGPKPVKAAVLVKCPVCGKEVSKRGITGHMQTHKGETK